MSDQPYAEITRMGRWLHSISIHHGMVEVRKEGGWFAFGQRRAERKAARVLRRYLLAEQRRQNPIRVEVPSGLSRESNPASTERTSDGWTPSEPTQEDR